MPRGRWEALEELVRLVETLETLEKAALIATERNKRSRGTPYQGALPANHVCHLATIYAEATSCTPTSTDTGPFMAFAREMVAALDIGIGDDGLGRAVDKGLREYKQAS
jgi:hypothetical protein